MGVYLPLVHLIEGVGGRSTDGRKIACGFGLPFAIAGEWNVEMIIGRMKGGTDGGDSVADEEEPVEGWEWEIWGKGGGDEGMMYIEDGGEWEWNCFHMSQSGTCLGDARDVVKCSFNAFMGSTDQVHRGSLQAFAAFSRANSFYAPHSLLLTCLMGFDLTYQSSSPMHMS